MSSGEDLDLDNLQLHFQHNTFYRHYKTPDLAAFCGVENVTPSLEAVKPHNTIMFLNQMTFL